MTVSKTFEKDVMKLVYSLTWAQGGPKHVEQLIKSNL